MSLILADGSLQLSILKLYPGKLYLILMKSERFVQLCQ